MDFFFFGILFPVSLPESLKTGRLRFSPPISESAEALRLRLPDLCDALRERFECGVPLFERFDCGVPLRDRFECREPLPDRFECCDGVRLRLPLRLRLRDLCDPLGDGERLFDGDRLFDVLLREPLRERLGLRDWLVRDAGEFERDLEL